MQVSVCAVGFCGTGTCLISSYCRRFDFSQGEALNRKALTETEAKIRSNPRGLLRLTAILTHLQNLNHTPATGMRRVTGVKRDESGEKEDNGERCGRADRVSWCRAGEQKGVGVGSEWHAGRSEQRFRAWIAMEYIYIYIYINITSNKLFKSFNSQSICRLHFE